MLYTIGDQSEISFSIPQGTFSWQSNSVRCSALHGCRWAHAASGVVGRANVRLFSASSSAATIFSLGGHWADSTGVWVDSIRQVDVDLDFLLVLYSTVGLYRLVCLSVGENRTRPPSWLILHSAHAVTSSH